MKSMPSLALFVVAASCFLLPFANAVDWPQWRGLNRDGISSEKISPASWGKDGPKQLWKKEIGTGVSSVAVEAGRLYTMGNTDNTDVVFCLDAATGAEIWQHTYPQALDLRQFEGGPAGTPTVDGDKVYTLSHQGDLFCLAASDGKVLWRKNLLRDFGGSRPRWGYAGSPLVDGNLVIVDSGGVGASTVALDKTNGALKWKAGDDGAGYSSPVAFKLAGSRCVAVFKADALVGLNAADGQELWRFPWKTAYDINAPTPLVLSDMSSLPLATTLAALWCRRVRKRRLRSGGTRICAASLAALSWCKALSLASTGMLAKASCVVSTLRAVK